MWSNVNQHTTRGQALNQTIDKEKVKMDQIWCFHSISTCTVVDIPIVPPV